MNKIFQYFFQRVACLPIEVEANILDEQDTNITTDKATVAQTVATTSQEREQAARVVLENIERALAREKKNYDKKVLTGKVMSFLIGQNLIVPNTRLS